VSGESNFDKARRQHCANDLNGPSGFATGPDGLSPLARDPRSHRLSKLEKPGLTWTAVFLKNLVPQFDHGSELWRRLGVYFDI
jgi:hypothetical protein